MAGGAFSGWGVVTASVNAAAGERTGGKLAFDMIDGHGANAVRR